MHKIVVTNDQAFTDDQKTRLESLGDVTYYDSLPTGPEYLERIIGADIVCSGTAGLKDVYAELHDTYITVGFVSVAFVDTAVLRRHNVLISNAPGANRFAVSEWIIGMMLMLGRRFDLFLNSTTDFRSGGNLPPLTSGLAGKSLTILGQGYVGQRVGEVAVSLGMDVRYFTRGDDLLASAKTADYVVNALSSNPTTNHLLNDRFFSGMKDGSTFINVARDEITDTEALIAALDSGKLTAVASDCGGILVGDTKDPLYQKLLNHPRAYVTPHVSYNTQLSMKIGNDIMIDNVEAFIAGKPINLVN